MKKKTRKIIKHVIERDINEALINEHDKHSEAVYRIWAMNFLRIAGLLENDSTINNDAKAITEASDIIRNYNPNLANAFVVLMFILRTNDTIIHNSNKIRQCTSLADITRNIETTRSNIKLLEDIKTWVKYYATYMRRAVTTTKKLKYPIYTTGWSLSSRETSKYVTNSPDTISSCIARDVVNGWIDKYYKDDIEPPETISMLNGD